ncbi:MAG: hypothetical protein ACKODB_00985 [Betaproteobacteria bacterium]
MDANGATLHTVPFACAPSASCLLPLPQDVVAKTSALQFRDNLGRLVGAYPKANLARTGYSVTVDADMTGVELFNRLVAQGVHTPATLVSLADEHIYREYLAGDSPSFFADLQAHYQRGLADPAYNEQKYLDDVLKAIADRAAGQTSAVNSTPSGQTVELKATSDTPACSASFKALNAFGGAIGKSLLKDYPLLGGFVDGLSGIIGGTCTTATITGKLDAIASKLDALQQSVDNIDKKITALGGRLDQMADDIAFGDFEKTRGDFNKTLDNLNSRAQNYYAVLRPIRSSGFTRPTYSNLSDYINTLGRLSVDTYDRDPSLKTLLGDLETPLKDFKTLTDQDTAKSMVTSLYTLCRDSTTIAGDIIARRDGCTQKSLQLIRDASVAAQQLSLWVSDALFTINSEVKAAEERGNPSQWDSRFLNPVTTTTKDKPLPTTWPEIRTRVMNDILEQLDAFVGVVSQSVFDPISGESLAPVSFGPSADGLPADLLKNIMLAGCTKSANGKQVAVGIESWVVNEVAGQRARNAKGEDSPYITTRCAGRNDELVYSRFHYTTDVGDGNTVLNMLGVLIKPADAVKNWGSMSWNGSGDYNDERNGDYLGGRWSNSPWVCITESDQLRCDWWMVVPGVTGTGKGDFTQVRSHTGPACGPQCMLDALFGKKTQRVPVSETYLYDPPVNDRIVHPVTGPRGRDAGYQSGAKSQYLWGSIWGNRYYYGPIVQEGFLSHTRVASENQADWDAKPDRRFTRTVVFRVGQTQETETDLFGRESPTKTLFFARCVTADCEWSHTSGVGFTKLKFTNGPTIQWNYFDNEWGAWHMFVDEKSSDDRPFPKR